MRSLEYSQLARDRRSSITRKPRRDETYRGSTPWGGRGEERCAAISQRGSPDVYRLGPRLFAHWRLGARPDGSTMEGGESGVHAGFCEPVGVKLPPGFHPEVSGEAEPASTALGEWRRRLDPSEDESPHRGRTHRQLPIARVRTRQRAAQRGPITRGTWFPPSIPLDAEERCASFT